MKLNRLVIATLVSSALMSAGTLAADTGTITFTGLITGQTCNTDVGGQGADAAVPLASGGEAALNTAGRTDGATRFTLSLSGCSSDTSAKAFFKHGSTVTADGRLRNTQTGGTAAQNVTLQLRDGQDNSVINIGDSSQVGTSATGYVAITGGSADLPYIVEYYAEGLVSAGDVASHVDYRIDYR